MRISSLPLSFHKKEGQQSWAGCKVGHSHVNETLSFEKDATVFNHLDQIIRCGNTYSLNLGFAAMGLATNLASGFRTYL